MPELRAAEQPARLRVAIVDRDRRVRRSLADLLRVAGDEELEVVGTAGDGRSALELIERRSPGVVLIDPQLPGRERGEALLGSIGLGWPRVRLVVMGWTDELEPLARAGGVAAYVAKSAAPETFVEAVVNVVRSRRPPRPPVASPTRGRRDPAGSGAGIPPRPGPRPDPSDRGR